MMQELLARPTRKTMVQLRIYSTGQGQFTVDVSEHATVADVKSAIFQRKSKVKHLFSPMPAVLTSRSVALSFSSTPRAR